MCIVVLVYECAVAILDSYALHTTYTNSVETL